MVQEVPLTAARAQLSELVNQVAYGDETVLLTRHGRAVVALVSASEYERFRDWVAAGGEQLPGAADRGDRGRLQVVETGSANPYGIAASSAEGPRAGL